MQKGWVSGDIRFLQAVRFLQARRVVVTAVLLTRTQTLRSIEEIEE